MNKITKFLRVIFAPRITKTYYYNGESVKRMSKQMEESFAHMNKAIKEMDKILEKDK